MMMVVVFCKPNGLSGDSASVASLVQKYDNLVVLQTMSKAFGLAGIRCGFAIGSEECISVMSKVGVSQSANLSLTQLIQHKNTVHIHTRTQIAGTSQNTQTQQQN
jgi:histidinol-phosphate/aromatic aminotransferase/cobyric acid decarboxylase-like protein